MLIPDNYGPYDTAIAVPVTPGTIDAWVDFVHHECDWCKAGGESDQGGCECITGFVGWWVDGGTDVIQRGPAFADVPRFVGWTSSFVDWARVPDDAWRRLLRRQLTIGTDPAALGPCGERSVLLGQVADHLLAS